MREHSKRRPPRPGGSDDRDETRSRPEGDLEPAVDEGFLAASDGIRAAALELVRQSRTIPDHRSAIGDDLQQAVQELRVFLEVDPRLLILTSAMKLSWSRGEVGGVREPMKADRGIPEWHPEIDVGSSSGMKDTLDEIVEMLDLPAPNTDYRVLAKWPEYFGEAWHDLRTFVGTDARRAACRTVDWMAKQTALALPARITVSPDRAVDLGLEPGEVEEVGRWIEAFDGLLPGLIVNTSSLYLGLLGGVKPVETEGHPSFEKTAR